MKLVPINEGQSGKWLEEAERGFETAEYLHRSGRLNVASTLSNPLRKH
ncbi:MAG: hypothetical protein QXS27_03680 [Candidatus Jordarchaeaceae archaeon]